MQRVIDKIITAVGTSDGDGVKIARSIGSRALVDIDPFLLLDEISSDEASDYIGGFPPHPHRGFETITYMLEGQMRHKDSEGNEGVIRSGDIQWMTAGSGIVHSEMPEQTEGKLWGFQIWLNLPSDQKMRQPRYQEISSQAIPEHIRENGKVRVLAGQIQSDEGTIDGAAKDIATEPLVLDIKLDHGQLNIPTPKDHTSVLYVYDGEYAIGQTAVKKQELAVLTPGDSLTISTDRPSGALLLAAKPLKEPIVRAGPFVLNTKQQLYQAYEDYQSGNFIKTNR